MIKVDYDIAIIGGGIAGLSLAIQSAHAGYKVIVYEKEVYPFHKVCGEYVSMESWNFLNRLGIPLDQWKLPLITQLEVTDTRGREYYFDLPMGGFGVSRYKLDDALYNLARIKGVDVRTGIKVQQINFVDNHFVVNTDTTMVTATVAIGAFGKRSNLDLKWKRPFTLQRATKLNNYIAVKYHVYYAQPDGYASIHNFKNGYCCITQVEEGKCCVYYMTTGRSFAEARNSIKIVQDQILSKNPRLKQIIKESTPVMEQPVAISHISFDKKEQVVRRILMVGDSAGLITPLCGNGMSMAMRGSLIAFNVINDFLKGTITRNEMESRYTKQWRETFRQRLSTGQRVQRFFGKRFTSNLFLRVMQLFPWLAKKILSVTHGEEF